MYKFHDEKTSICNSSHEQKNQHAISFENEEPTRKKFYEQNQFHKERKSMYEFDKKKNQHATSVTNKNQHIASSMSEKSTCKNFHEQNEFHEEKNQCICFTRRKIDMRQVLRTE